MSRVHVVTWLLVEWPFLADWVIYYYYNHWSIILRGSLHTSRIGHLLLYPSLQLLVPGLSSQFLPYFPIQPAFEISTGRLDFGEMATRFWKLQEPLSNTDENVATSSLTIITNNFSCWRGIWGWRISPVWPVTPGGPPRDHVQIGQQSVCWDEKLHRAAWTGAEDHSGTAEHTETWRRLWQLETVQKGNSLDVPNISC